ncbi:MAG: MATE family efflux transporter, partial [Deltaproteobacteria bacterium]|nr:MATE family efflux transporter [Deltaproteobacteria bacterium]
IGLVLGGLLALAGLLGGQQGIPVLGAEGETARLAWAYFRWIAMGVPLIFISSVLRAVLTGEGDARSPMLVITLGTLINLALDPLFIFVFGWGIEGAAWATLVAQSVSCALLILLVARRRRVFAHFRLASVWPRWHVLSAVAGIGLPAALGQMVMAVGSALNNWLLSTFGQVTVAGYGAASRVDLLVVLPIIGLGGGALSVVGMFAGAGRVDLVRSTTIYTYRSVVIVALIAGGSAFLLSDMILSLFTAEAQAIAVGKQYLGFMVFAYPLMAFGITSGRILQGLGYGLPTLIITMVRVLLVGVGGAYVSVLVFNAPLSAVWISIISGGLVANILAALWVRHYVWLRDPTGG